MGFVALLLRRTFRRRGAAWLASAALMAEQAYRIRAQRGFPPGAALPPPTWSTDGQWWWDGRGWHSSPTVNARQAPPTGA